MNVSNESDVQFDPEDEGPALAWREEIAKRVAEIRNGQAVGRPVEEMLADLKERYL